FSGSDEFSVILHIPAQIKDRGFVGFLNQIVQKKSISLSFQEIYQLERVREGLPIQNELVKKKLLDQGFIEKIGKTNDSKYILSHRYYQSEGRPGVYTRLVGISREKRKELIIKHLQKYGKGQLIEFQDIFPELKSGD